jgi:PIN domain nuclease of toxin-antitoxin system
MKVLLDTQIAIWALTDTRRLNERAKTLIADYANDVFVSAVSVWEIAIKFALGKRASAPPFSGEVALNAFLTAGFQMLNVTPRHAASLDGLPPLHGDPFDRMLIAQALSEPLRLLTADRALAAYGAMVMLEI